MAKLVTAREIKFMVDGLPWLRTSERTAFRRCPQAWWWGTRQGLKPKAGAAQALWFGTGWHLGLSEYYLPGFKRGVDPIKTWLDYCDREHEMVPIFKDEGKEYMEARDLGVEMFKGYKKKWAEEDKGWKFLAPEMTAYVALRDPDTGEHFVNYLMTADGVFENHNHEAKPVELLENKTAARMVTTHLPRDDQAGTYPFVMTDYLRKMKVIVDPIETVRYSIARKDVPKPDDRPRDENGLALNKDGSVSKRQEAQAPLFHREDVYRSREEQTNQIRRIRAEVNAMNYMREDPENRLYKNHDQHCAWCPFIEMCDLHEAGGDWETLRDWAFYRQDPYAPYELRKVA